MTASHPWGSVIALVGGGLGSLLVHWTARRPSLENRDIAILGTNDDPVATCRHCAQHLGQTISRSEFESRVLALDRPTFPQLDAYARKSAKPFWLTRTNLVGRPPGSDQPDAVQSRAPVAARRG
jgi:hypothetical protein